MKKYILSSIFLIANMTAMSQTVDLTFDSTLKKWKADDNSYVGKNPKAGDNLTVNGCTSFEIRLLNKDNQEVEKVGANLKLTAIATDAEFDQNMPYKLECTCKDAGIADGDKKITYKIFKQQDDKVQLQSISEFLKSDKAYSSKFKKKYNRLKNEAYIFLDESGKPVDNIPVNVDENDVFHFFIVSKTDDPTKYLVEAPDAVFKPTDLAIRPSSDASAEAAGAAPVISYKVSTFSLGPYTSETVSFQVYKVNTGGSNTLLNTVTLTINNIYHGAVGVSAINSWLPSTSYELIDLPGSTNKTIVATNDKGRGILIANYIYYLGGRDVIKEPTPGQRFGIMFGTSLTNKFSENFFAGGVYEFARGGSITGGLHYGKQSVLADKNFKLGTTAFSGTKDEIKLSSEWNINIFLGISLDLRIFRGIIGISE
jgi:hypothetical protein